MLNKRSLRWHVAIAIVFASVGLGEPARAQTSSVVEHFRAYRAALQENDLETAEREAQAALDASRARDGDGGRTAILALNLATTRILRGDGGGAIEPAAYALARAEAGNTGLSVTHARLTLGRAELMAIGRPGADRLLALIAGDNVDAPAEDLFDAGSELGVWAIRQRDYPAAEVAWSFAGAHAEGSVLGRDYGLGRARTFEALAIFFGDIGVRGNRRVDLDRARDLYRVATEAAETLRPLANEEAPDLSVTIAQQAFAEALALRSAIRAKLTADGRTAALELGEAQGDGADETGAPAGAPPRCLMRVVMRPTPSFPSSALERGQLAGVVVRLVIGENGEVQQSEVAASIGFEGYAQAVARAAPRWGVERRDDSPPNCRMRSNLYVPIAFIIA